MILENFDSTIVSALLSTYLVWSFLQARSSLLSSASKGECGRWFWRQSNPMVFRSKLTSVINMKASVIERFSIPIILLGLFCVKQGHGLEGQCSMAERCCMGRDSSCVVNQQVNTFGAISRIFVSVNCANYCKQSYEYLWELTKTYKITTQN